MVPGVRLTRSCISLVQKVLPLHLRKMEQRSGEKKALGKGSLKRDMLMNSLLMTN